MFNKQFHFDKKSIKFKEYDNSLKSKLKVISIKLFIGLLIGGGLSFYILNSFIFPEKKELLEENQQINKQYNNLSSEIENLEQVILDLKSRDHKLHGKIFNSNIDKKKGILNIDSLNNLSADKIVEISSARCLKAKNISDSLVSRLRDVLDSTNITNIDLIPNIMPIHNKNLKKTGLGWTWRMHPIYKIPKFHFGIDFTTPIGTKVYATANGKVTKVKSNTVHGKYIEITHSNGYTSRYSHLRNVRGVVVKKNKKVKKGDHIGYVGTSGMTISPHLHYEVLKDKKRVNPTNYFFGELSPEETLELKLISKAQKANIKLLN